MGKTVDPSGFNRADGWSVRSLSGQRVPSVAGLQPVHYTTFCSRNPETSSSNEHTGLCSSYKDLRCMNDIQDGS